MLNREQLLNNLRKAFDEQDLRTLCFYLGMDYDELRGIAKGDKSRELVIYCEQHGRTEDLVNKCSELRPHIDWKTSEPIESSRGRPVPLSVVMQPHDEHVTKVINLVGKSEYIEAVNYAREHQREFEESTLGVHPRFRLTRAEFDVWHAHALMYTGQQSRAISILKTVIDELEKTELQYKDKSLRVKWGTVLGRAHNHIGYINWMDLGRYEVALLEFKNSIHYCELVETADELATAYDNMGRVYAELGYFTRAKFLIERGREFRKNIPDIRRRDHSLVSSSIAHLANGEPNHALLITEVLCNNKDQSQSDRIFGLTLLARARALRYLAASTYLREVKTDLEKLKEADLEKLKEAETFLWDKARPIFTSSGETIRQFQLYNELGCIKRERARLLIGSKQESDASKEIEDAIEMLEFSLDYVCEQNRDGSFVYPAHYLDTCIDIAETYILDKQKRTAEEWLDRGVKALPMGYNLGQEDVIIESEDSLEDLWQQLGKAAVLRGQIAFTNVILPASPPKDRLPDDLYNAIRYYTFAIGYFGRFLSRPLKMDNCNLYPTYRPQLANHRLFVERLYDNLKTLSPEYWRLIEQEVTKLEEVYQIKHTWIQVFYGDTLNFLLQIAGSR